MTLLKVNLVVLEEGKLSEKYETKKQAMQILPCFLVSVAEATVLGINTHSIAPIPGQFEMIKRAGKYTFKIFRV